MQKQKKDSVVASVGVDIREELFSIRRVKLEEINTLPQQRKTFEDESLIALAENIKEIGNIEPIVVCQFTHDECLGYLEVMNELWSSGLSIDTLIANSRGEYLILIAGERRYRAMGILGFAQRNVSLGVGVEPLHAISIQFAENTYEPPPLHEQAYAHRNFFLVMRKRKPGISVAEYARQVGRRPEWMRKVLKFCDLPLRARSLVETGTVPFGIGVELSRLEVAGLPSKEIVRLIEYAAVSGMRVDEFRSLVSRKLSELNSGQVGMFSSDQGVSKRANRLTFEKQLVMLLWSQISYTTRVGSAIDNGLLMIDKAPFSERSPVRELYAAVCLMMDLTPQMTEHMTKKQVSEFYSFLPQMRYRLESLLSIES